MGQRWDADRAHYRKYKDTDIEVICWNLGKVNEMLNMIERTMRNEKRGDVWKNKESQ